MIGFLLTGPRPSFIQVYPAIANSTVDFVDLHVGDPITAGQSVDVLAQSLGFVGHQQQKPILMGEFSAATSDYPLITDAASALQNWQVQSCTYAFKGWLLWTWDLEPSEAEPGEADWAATSGDGRH